MTGLTNHGRTKRSYAITVRIFQIVYTLIQLSRFPNQWLFAGKYWEVIFVVEISLRERYSVQLTIYSTKQ